VTEDCIGRTASAIACAKPGFVDMISDKG